RALQLAELQFEECRVSKENMLGSERMDFKRGGFQGGMQTFYLARPAVAAMAVGIGRAAVEEVAEALGQAGSSHVMGRQWRAESARIEEMKQRLQAARLLCWQAAWLYDEGKENVKEASMAKALSGQVGMAVCLESMEIAARTGAGDMAMLERLLRNVKA